MRSLPSFAWSGLCASLALLCIAVWLLPVDWQIALRWRADGWLTTPWTLWSASITHLSDPHLLANLVGLLCLAIIGEHLGANHHDALALLIAWPLTHLALLLWSQIQFYAGFSGLNYALAGIIIARSAIHFIVNRLISVIAFIFTSLLLAKLIWEAPWAQPLRMDASWGFTVVQAAHLSGAVCGFAALVLIAVLSRGRISKPNGSF
jgi:membrane associated rhomboid family serine protease